MSNISRPDLPKFNPMVMVCVRNSRQPTHRRARLRPDYAVRVYRYDLARIIGGVPDGVWDTAKAMQALWNDLVAIFEAYEEKRRDIEEKEPRRALDAEMRLAIREMAKSYGDRLDNYCYYFVRDRMLESISRYRSGKGGRPKPHRGLRKIVLPYKGNDGGQRVGKLFSGEYRRLSLRRSSGPTRGEYTSNGITIPFEVVLHREIPPEAYVKSAALTGRRVRPFGWEWAINVTVEEPPPDAPTSSLARTAALDLGWRVLEDALRIGVLVTEDGEAAELRLPFRADTASLRRIAGRFGERGESSRFILDWRDIARLQEMSDVEMDLAKERIKDLVSPYVRSLLPRIRGRGLDKLLRELKEAGGSGAAIAALEEWQVTHYQFWRAIAGGRERLQKRRDWLYHNLACWLAETFPRLIWEGDLGLRDMSRKQSDPVLQNAQQYRAMASLSKLRLAIIEAYRKRGGVIVNERSASTTATCAWCDGAIDTGPELELVCENGHRSDQDVNAAKVMLLRQGIKLRAVTGFSESVGRSHISTIVRPLSS